MPAVILALALSAVAVGGSLYLSLGLNLKACPLCFYQRTFAFALVGVLAVGLLLPDRRPGHLLLLALPLAVGGLGVAGFHVYLELSRTLECPTGIGGLGSAPQQSAAVFGLILATVAVGLVGELREKSELILPAVVAALLGVGFAVGSIIANPPLPPVPAQPYPAEQKIEICRPVYKG
jgi:hypothetical protein